MKKNLIVFHPCCIDYNVSKEVLSQYDFLKNAKHIFEKNNINVIYFYELLPPERARKYYDIEENFKYSFQELLSEYRKKDHTYLINLTRNEYKDAIVHCFEGSQIKSVGSKHRLFSIYDPHAMNTLKNKVDNYNILNVEHHNVDDCKLFEEPDLIITSSNKYFKNINSKYQEKTEFIPFSYNQNNKKIFELQKFDSYFNREKISNLKDIIDEK